MQASIICYDTYIPDHAALLTSFTRTKRYTTCRRRSKLRDEAFVPDAYQVYCTWVSPGWHLNNAPSPPCGKATKKLEAMVLSAANCQFRRRGRADNRTPPQRGIGTGSPRPASSSLLCPRQTRCLVYRALPIGSHGSPSTKYIRNRTPQRRV